MRTRRIRYFALLTSSIFLLPAIAMADTVQGTVAGTSRNTLDLTVFDGQGHPYPNKLHLKVDNRTRLGGYASTASIRKNDVVRADLSQEKTGAWHIDSINKLQAVQPMQQTPAQTSPSLMDALKSPTGQKVIRNGLTGALTGAVASGASGGKVGKGALIGAGVGVAGGLLMDLFGQRQQNVQQPATSSTLASQQDVKG